MRILYWPALSPFNASSRLLRRARRSLRLVAASRTASRFEACPAKPWNARTNSPSANASVRLSPKLSIIARRICDLYGLRQASILALLSTIGRRQCWPLTAPFRTDNSFAKGGRPAPGDVALLRHPFLYGSHGALVVCSSLQRPTIPVYRALSVR